MKHIPDWVAQLPAHFRVAKHKVSLSYWRTRARFAKSAPKWRRKLWHAFLTGAAFQCGRYAVILIVLWWLAHR